MEVKMIDEIEKKVIDELFNTLVSIPKENAIPIDTNLYIEIAKILKTFFI